MYLLGRNDAINRWLDDNPAVFGGGAIVLGLLMLAFGAKTLITGKSTGKYGQKYEGGAALFHGVLRTGFGICLILFGLYKLVGAAF